MNEWVPSVNEIMKDAPDHATHKYTHTTIPGKHIWHADEADEVQYIFCKFLYLMPSKIADFLKFWI